MSRLRARKSIRRKLSCTVEGGRKALKNSTTSSIWSQNSRPGQIYGNQGSDARDHITKYDGRMVDEATSSIAVSIIVLYPHTGRTKSKDCSQRLAMRDI